MTPVAGYANTTVFGISDNGVVVGSVWDGSVESGLIIDKNGAVTVFNHPDAVSFTQARGIKNSGEVVGHYFDGTTQIGYIARPQ